MNIRWFWAAGVTVVAGNVEVGGSSAMSLVLTLGREFYLRCNSSTCSYNEPSYYVYFDPLGGSETRSGRRRPKGYFLRLIALLCAKAAAGRTLFFDGGGIVCGNRCQGTSQTSALTIPICGENEEVTFTISFCTVVESRHSALGNRIIRGECCCVTSVSKYYRRTCGFSNSANICTHQKEGLGTYRKRQGMPLRAVAKLDGWCWGTWVVSEEATTTSHRQDEWSKRLTCQLTTYWIIAEKDKLRCRTSDMRQQMRGPLTSLGNLGLNPGSHFSADGSGPRAPVLPDTSKLGPVGKTQPLLR
ncbi:hypothetical protein BU15DRAFT_67067 [Melanogaster broomeanus]|nr:hypothetical protein BU15DRAFT_67067 [Melanogaster broomeanus]